MSEENCPKCGSSQLSLKHAVVDTPTDNKQYIRDIELLGIWGGILFVLFGLGLAWAALYIFQARRIASGNETLWIVLTIGALSALGGGLRAILAFFRDLAKVKVVEYRCNNCKNMWEIRGTARSAPTISAIRWTGRIIASCFLLGVLFLAALSVSSNSSCEYSFQGKEYQLFYVDFPDGTHRDLALVKPGRLQSTFMDPEKPESDLILWNGHWRTLKKSCSVNNLTRLFGK